MVNKRVRGGLLERKIRGDQLEKQGKEKGKEKEKEKGERRRERERERERGKNNEDW